MSSMYRAEAGPRADSERYWAKSSSHGNLIGLHTANAASDSFLPKAGQRSRSGNLPTTSRFNAEIHKVAPREDTARYAPTFFS